MELIIHTFKGEYANAVTPLVLGHEFSGKVVAVGDEVTKVKPGDRVTSETTFDTLWWNVYTARIKNIIYVKIDQVLEQKLTVVWLTMY